MFINSTLKIVGHTNQYGESTSFEGTWYFLVLGIEMSRKIFFPCVKLPLIENATLDKVPQDLLTLIDIIVFFISKVIIIYKIQKKKLAGNFLKQNL